jgi:hypothetical protein
MDFLENENVQHMDWLAMSPDFNPIENHSLLINKSIVFVSMCHRFKELAIKRINQYY